MANCILFATDFSPISEHAFDEAVKLGKLMGADLIISHVLDFPPMVGSAFLPSAEETEEAMRRWCRQCLAELEKKAKAHGLKAQTILREGAHAHEGITKLAEEMKAVMIVLGTHGRTGFSKLVLGSVAARVISEAPCPVLTVRSKEALGATREPS